MRADALAGQRQLGIALAGKGREAKFTEGSIDRKTRRARERAAAKLNAAQQAPIIAARRGTKLSARDTFTVLHNRRMDKR